MGEKIEFTIGLAWPCFANTQVILLRDYHLNVRNIWHSRGVPKDAFSLLFPTLSIMAIIHNNGGRRTSLLFVSHLGWVSWQWGVGQVVQRRKERLIEKPINDFCLLFSVWSNFERCSLFLVGVSLKTRDLWSFTDCWLCLFSGGLGGVLDYLAKRSFTISQEERTPSIKTLSPRRVVLIPISLSWWTKLNILRRFSLSC